MRCARLPTSARRHPRGQCRALHRLQKQSCAPGVALGLENAPHVTHNLYHLDRSAAHRAHDDTRRLRGRICRIHCDPPCVRLGAGEDSSGSHAAPRERPRKVNRRHDGDGGGVVGGRVATALQSRRVTFQDSPGLNWGVPVHGRSLAADEARARAGRLTAECCGIGSIKARQRSHFGMIEFDSSLGPSRDRCKKLLSFFSAYSLRTPIFGQWDGSAAQNSAIECTRYRIMVNLRETVLWPRADRPACRKA